MVEADHQTGKLSGWEATVVDRVNMSFRLDGPALTPATFVWPLYREFMDHLLRALEAIAGGPKATEVAPVAVREGSACPVISMPRANMKGVYRFRGGPTASWSAVERRAAEPIYEFVREHAIQMQCGVRALHPIVVPDSKRPWTLVERTTLSGSLRRLGGTRVFKAEIDFDHHGLIACTLDETLAKQMAPMLFERVSVSGVLRRDAQNHAILSFELIEARRRSDARLSLAEWQRRSLEVLDGGLDPTQVDEYLEDIRR